jgi:hypothetical protein
MGAMEEALAALRADVATCQALEDGLRGKPPGPQSKARPAKAKAKEQCIKVGKPDSAADMRNVNHMLAACVQTCQDSRKRHREESGPPDDTSDAALSQYTRFTDQIALEDYKQFLHYVPRLVNVVTLAEAIPMEGSGLSLPLNLANIAARCKGSYYAPRRFAVSSHSLKLAYTPSLYIAHSGWQWTPWSWPTHAFSIVVARKPFQSNLPLQTSGWYTLAIGIPAFVAACSLTKSRSARSPLCHL